MESADRDNQVPGIRWEESGGKAVCVNREEEGDLRLEEAWAYDALNAKVRSALSLKNEKLSNGVDEGFDLHAPQQPHTLQQPPCPPYNLQQPQILQQPYAPHSLQQSYAPHTLQQPDPPHTLQQPSSHFLGSSDLHTSNEGFTHTDQLSGGSSDSQSVEDADEKRELTIPHHTATHAFVGPTHAQDISSSAFGVQHTAGFPNQTEAQARAAARVSEYIGRNLRSSGPMKHGVESKGGLRSASRDSDDEPYAAHSGMDSSSSGPASSSDESNDTHSEIFKKSSGANEALKREREGVYHGKGSGLQEGDDYFDSYAHTESEDITQNGGFSLPTRSSRGRLIRKRATPEMHTHGDMPEYSERGGRGEGSLLNGASSGGGVRTSSRAKKMSKKHYTDADEDTEVSRPARQIRSSRGSRSRGNLQSDYYAQSSDEDDEYSWRSQTSHAPAKGMPSRKSSQNRSRDSFHSSRIIKASSRQPSLRDRKTVNYAALGEDYETDEEDRQIDALREAEKLQRNDQSIGIDRILSVRVNPETGEREFLTKWKGQAHIHNAYEVYENLLPFHGIKKVDNFIKRQDQLERRRMYMTADEIEQEDIALELQRQLDEDALIAERIVDVGPDPATGIETFLIKWKSCAYDQCTWEVRETLESHNFAHLIKEYFEREDRIQGESAKKSIWNTQSISRTMFEPYKCTPDYISKNCPRRLRDYQLTGLNWMVSRMKHGLSVLLADEMGLGKTVQTISFIGHLLYKENLVGPFLLIVPQSTIDNWMREFEYWMPQANAVCFYGNASARDILRYYELRQVNVEGKGKRWRFDACVATPSILNSPVDVDFLRNKIIWQLLVVDEAHQLKNRNSKRFQELQQFQAEYKLLLSGTPLHNNLEELWSLLHFMNPLMYTYYEDFKRKYPDVENTMAIGEAKQKQLEQLQKELHEVVLRRVKKDVEKSLPNKVESILRVEMSPLQVTWYRNILTRNYEQLAKSTGGARNSLQNICMELKKVCNHPFLCHSPDDNGEFQYGLVYGSGKMCLLEKLLYRLKEKNHRALIFSQMVRMLNILSEYLTMKGFKHQRLDGSMGKEVRKKAMDHFNDPASDDFVFLLSTKAGGLGINLTSADTVIIYDSDWNPQNDLQAEARAHRIGQTKTVQIYRLVTRDSIEQTILERAKSKMVLDTLVVQGLNKKDNGAPSELLAGGSSNSSFSREELSRILKFGASKLWGKGSEALSTPGDLDVDLDKILEEAETTVTENGGAADDLLSSYNNITEFRYEPPTEDPNTSSFDKDFWSQTIPLEERLKVQKSKQQELLVSGPRKTRAKDFYVSSIKEEDEESDVSIDSEAIDDTVKTKRGGKHKKKTGNLSDKDRYRLYRSLLKFGSPATRLSDIHEDSRLKRFDEKIIAEECENIIKICKQKLRDIGYDRGFCEDNADNFSEVTASIATPTGGNAVGSSINSPPHNASLLGSNSGSELKEDVAPDSPNANGSTARHFVVIGENKANAVDLVERVELLTKLDAFIKAQNPPHHMPWKLATGPLAVTKSQPLGGEDEEDETLKSEVEGFPASETKETTEEDVNAKETAGRGDVKPENSTGGGRDKQFLKLQLPENVLKKLKDWTAKDVRNWGSEQDTNLMRGTYVYGFGSWTEVYNDANLKLEQIKEIKYDKVKMRALRILKLLGAATCESKSRKEKKSYAQDSTSLSQSPNVAEDNANDLIGSLSDGKLASPSELSSQPEGCKPRKKRKIQPLDEEIHSEHTRPARRQGNSEKDMVFNFAEMSEEDLGKAARHALKPVKKALKSMKKMTNDDGCSDSEVIGQMKSSLPLVGEAIERASSCAIDEQSAELLQRACWKYVSKFTIANVEDLQRVYHQIRGLSGASWASQASVKRSDSFVLPRRTNSYRPSQRRYANTMGASINSKASPPTAHHVVEEERVRGYTRREAVALKEPLGVGISPRYKEAQPSVYVQQDAQLARAEGGYVSSADNAMGGMERQASGVANEERVGGMPSFKIRSSSGRHHSGKLAHQGGGGGMGSFSGETLEASIAPLTHHSMRREPSIRASSQQLTGRKAVGLGISPVSGVESRSEQPFPPENSLNLSPYPGGGKAGGLKMVERGPSYLGKAVSQSSSASSLSGGGNHPSTAYPTSPMIMSEAPSGGVGVAPSPSLKRGKKEMIRKVSSKTEGGLGR